MTFAFSGFLFVAGVLITSSCGHQSRVEGRQERLDTFRSSLPPTVMNQFDAIESKEDCADVGLLLEEARHDFPEVENAIDSIVNAELIDAFSNEEIVYFFWYYFDYAIETGSVSEP